MKRTPKSPAAVGKSSNVFTVAKRHSMPGHERLLLSVQECLPGLLAQELQNANPLNEYVRSNVDDWQKRIEEVISERRLKDSEAKIWRQLLDLCFADPKLDLATTELGATLTRRMESARSHRAWAPILVADVAIRVKIPHWSSLYLRDGTGASYPKTPVSKPLDCVSIDQLISHVPIYGQVFPSGCQLGEVAIEMARLADAVEQHLYDIEHFRYSDSSNHVLLVTDSERLFDALAGQYNAVWFREDEESVSWDIDKLQSFHKVAGY